MRAETGVRAGARVHGLEALVIGEQLAVGAYIGRRDGVLRLRAGAVGALYGGFDVFLAHRVPLVGEAAARQQQREREGEGDKAFFHRTASM